MPGHNVDDDSQALDKAGVVRRVVIGLGVRSLQHGTGESLRRLDGPQCRTIDRLQHIIVGIDALDGVDDRKPGDDRMMAGAHRCNDGGDELGRDQRSSGVVDENHVDIVRKGQQGTGDRALPGIAAGHDEDVREIGLAGKEGGHRLDVIGGRCDHDEVDSTTGGQGTDRMDEHRHTAEFAQSLGRSGSEAFAATRGGHQDRGPGLLCHGGPPIRRRA